MNVSYFRHLPFFLCLIACISNPFTRVNAQYSSDSARIYLITASPGTETYSAFGHSGIRIADRVRGFDIVYNYGTFDFRTPHFYFKFSTGRLLYFLSAAHFEDFKYEYIESGQALYQQELNLTNKEKWQLIQNLQTNYAPENRYYRYDFFRDNCATRIRDIIQRSVDGKIVYDPGFVTKNQSFRQLVAQYFHHDPWVLLGLNLLLGTGADSIAGLTDYMFLPEHMRDLYARTKVSSGDTVRFLAGKPVELFPTTLSFPKPPVFTSPVVLGWSLFILIALLTWWEIRKKFVFKWLDFIFFLPSGLLGALLLFLAVASLHKVLHQNYNLVWANPVNLILVVGLFFKPKTWYIYVMTAYGALIILFIPFSFLLTQTIPAAVYPLVCILALRVIRNVIFRDGQIILLKK